MSGFRDNDADDGDLFDSGMFHHARITSARSRPLRFPLSASEMRRHVVDSTPDAQGMPDGHDTAHVRHQLPKSAHAGQAPGGPMVRGRRWNESN